MYRLHLRVVERLYAWVGQDRQDGPGRVRAGEGTVFINGRTRTEVGTLRAILKRRGLWAHVQPHVRMLPTSDDHGKALTEDEEKRLLEACRLSRSTALLPVVELALNTGMRLGEILNLRWGDVELKARRLVVRKSKTKAGTGARCL